MTLRNRLLVLCGLLALATLPVAAQEGPSPLVVPREIQMTAKKYEFNPGTITVKKGERVKLVITALDKDHGIKIEALGIEQILKKGVATTVELLADSVGEFPFQCSKFCGFGHGTMKGKLVVEE